MECLKLIQDEMKNNPDITFDENSACWNRMHAHYKTKKICKYHPINSYHSLFDLLHEIGHIRSGNPHNRALEETQATLWAINRMGE